MDAKKTVGFGVGALVLGILWAAWQRAAVVTVLSGSIGLILLLLGILFVLMGLVQVREERAADEKERAEARQQADMAAQAKD